MNSKYYWNGYIKQSLYMFQKLDDKTLQGKLASNAIKKALKKIETSDCGKEKIKYINMFYIQKTHTQSGACLELGISERTGQRWSQEFFSLISKYMGFSA